MDLITMVGIGAFCGGFILGACIAGVVFGQHLGKVKEEAKAYAVQALNDVLNELHKTAVAEEFKSHEEDIKEQD